MPTVLITGATRGLGLATLRAARARQATVLGAGRDGERLRTTVQRYRAEPVLLDLGDLRSVRRVAVELPAVDVVVCNAGLQILDGPTSTADGFEETFQVNHLAHLALVDALLARERPPRRVILVGSGTHDPAVRTGTPDPLESDPVAYARVRDDTEPARTAGVRRYATTKLLAVATAAALAREQPSVHVSCFDPGLMPGTGLARQYSPAARLAWSTVFRAAQVLPFASSPAASGRALAALACDLTPPAPSGCYLDHRLRVRPPSRLAQDRDYQDRVLEQSRALLAAAG